MSHEPSSTSLDELAAHPERVHELPTDARRRLVPQLAGLIVLLSSNSVSPASPESAPRPTKAVCKLLTVPTAAERMGFKKSYVYYLIRRGELAAVRRGRYVRVRESAIEQWIRDHEG